MHLRDVIHRWGSTSEERRRHFGCDDVLPAAAQVLFRAVTVDAPPAVVYRWLCQLKLAPYSYDLIDNGGRRSPRHLVEGIDELEVGERAVAVFRIAAFTPGEELTLTTRRHWAFGDVAMSYAALPHGDGRTRLVAKIAMDPPPGVVGAVMGRVLPAGDLVMMRRQLLNLKALAESTPADAVPATAPR